jgi:hypothetical protein
MDFLAIPMIYEFKGEGIMNPLPRFNFPNREVGYFPIHQIYGGER